MLISQFISFELIQPFFVCTRVSHIVRYPRSRFLLSLAHSGNVSNFISIYNSITAAAVAVIKQSAEMERSRRQNLCAQFNINETSRCESVVHWVYRHTWHTIPTYPWECERTTGFYFNVDGATVAAAAALAHDKTQDGVRNLENDTSASGRAYTPCTHKRHTHILY